MKKRESFIDLIKVIATIFALSVHAINLYFKFNNNSNGLMSSLIFILDSLFKTATPLFIITTGYLNFKNKKYQNSYKKLFYLMCIYILIGIITRFIKCYLGENIDFRLFIYQLLSFKINDYAWFFQMYIGLFLLFSPLNRLYNTFNNKKEKFKLIFTLLIIIVVPYIISNIQNIAFGYDVYSGYFSFLYPILYYYIGCYIAEYNVKFKLCKETLILLIIMLFPMILYTEVLFINKLSLYLLNNYFYSIGIISLSVLIFIIIKNINVKNIIVRKILKNISIYSFQIVLFSYSLDLLMYCKFNVIIHVLLNFILSYFCSMILTSFINVIIKKIKAMKCIRNINFNIH